MSKQSAEREHWGSSVGFILAAAGSAIGLGNIWKFPYITGENGGGAFVLVYLLCIAVIGVPVMLCEITLGRHTQRNPVGAFKQLSPRSSKVAHLIGLGIILTAVFLFCFQSWGWGVTALLVGFLIFRFGWILVGAMGVAAGFVILSFYSVVAGWTLGYTLNSALGDLDMDPARQKPELLAHVLLAEVRQIPNAVKASVDAEDLAPLEQDRKLERLAQARAAAYVKEHFELVLPEATGRVYQREFATSFVRSTTAKIAAADLLEHLGEHFGGVTETTNADGDTTRVFPRKLNTAVAGQRFRLFMDNPVPAIGWHFVFMVMCVTIVCMGVQKGIERASKILMPTLFVLILALIVRGLTLDGAVAGVRFYLSPDFSKLNPGSVLIALGHAFFSLSLGMGAIITYGSYVKREQNLFISVLSITALDTLIALMAGLAIFPAVFAAGFDPGAGPGLVFQILPAVFNAMPFGPFWATLFFLLLLVAALTSAISLLEVVTAYFVDERKWSRRMATITFGGVIFLLGCLCAISVADWDRLLWLQATLCTVFGSVRGSFFDVLDTLASNWMLPLGGLFIALFVGWIWGTKKAVDEIRHGSHNFADVHLFSLLAGLKDDHSHNSEVHVITLASVWGIFIRFISPVAVLVAFLNTIGWLDLTAKRKAAPPPPPPPAEAEPAAAAAEHAE